MWIKMDERYEKERDKFGLKVSCEDCRHYCLARNKCGMLYPVDPHLKKTFDEAKMGDRIFFCKMFEAK